ncbi:hypothetical protein Ari01nite_63060 [Paractinoplanes rishiriensis]|uniref:Uncharacterized protein n=2 Tax=Paractinoplanes rishiriensis TaxID=1050105 RepID=A0A919MT32_9ACTN|nr:hypothetical protein Ari01nite_63060 [Actinoplanes rishiriensis]
MIGRLAAWGAGLAMVLVAAGCGGDSGAGDSTMPAEAPLVQPTWESCAAAAPSARGLDGAQDALSMPRLDGSFQPVSAVVCGSAPVKQANGSTALVASENKATDIAAVVAALRLPDEAPTDGACTMDLPVVPWLALVDADGRWVQPGVPKDACGKPRIEFRDAFGAMRTTQVSAKPVQELESAEAAKTGCGQSWADMVWATSQMGLGRTALPVLPAADAAARICVYTVPEDQRGTGKPAGRFASGGRLAAEKWAGAREQLTVSKDAAACSTPATRFAVLQVEQATLYVEADGCERVLVEAGGRSSLRQGSESLGTLLFG